MELIKDVSLEFVEVSSLYENKRTEVGEFFLSCRELGKRLGVSHEKANRILYEFSEELQLIKLIENGKTAGRESYHL